MNKKKSKIIIVTIITVIFSLIIAAYLFLPKETPIAEHEFILGYDYQNSFERQVINVSESLNYEEILGMPRYNQSMGGEVTIHVPNYIDKTVIEDYIEIYENTNEDFDKWFNYSVRAIKIKNSTIRYSVDYEPANLIVRDGETGQQHHIEVKSTYSLEVNTCNETVYTYRRTTYGYYDPIIASNSSGNFVFLNGSQNLTIFISDGFITEMSLRYRYSSGCCRGGSISKNQIVILDTGNNPTHVFHIQRK